EGSAEVEEFGGRAGRLSGGKWGLCLVQGLRTVVIEEGFARQKERKGAAALTTWTPFGMDECF
ncbi:MAG: hypothetical protein WAK48_21120, partial [Candidatus Acidiferrum sp.]